VLYIEHEQHDQAGQPGHRRPAIGQLDRRHRLADGPRREHQRGTQRRKQHADEPQHRAALAIELFERATHDRSSGRRRVTDASVIGRSDRALQEFVGGLGRPRG
jgi:hypothetical protein